MGRLKTPAQPVLRRALLLEVKLPDRVASLELDFGPDGLYRTRKLRNRDGHFSLHKYIEGLPASAGIAHDRGVRKDLYRPALRTRLQSVHPDAPEEREAERRLMIDWDEWERVLTDARGSKHAHLRRFQNET